MLAVRVDRDMAVVWTSKKSAAAGVRCGSVGQGAAPTADIVEFVRRCKRAMVTGETQRYQSSLGAVLIIPDDDGAVAYLQPFDIGGELQQLPAEVGDLRT